MHYKLNKSDRTLWALAISPDKVFPEKYLSVSLFKALVLGVNLLAVD
jgi:hypothetical protein